MRKNKIQRSVLPIFGFVLLLGLASASMAYTVVFRDGRKVEVPSAFTVTATTFSYEAAPGINKTVQLTLIDVAATERANNEAPGAFFKHVAGTVAPVTPIGHAQHTLTNRDLEPSRLRRIESEQNYEKRRIELGLPSIEETRRRQALEEESMAEMARRRAAQEASDEAYWRGRAGALRSEIVSVDAELNYLRARLGPLRQVPLITQGFVVGGGSFGSFGGRPARSQPGAGRSGTQARNMGSQNLTNLGAVALRPRRQPGFSRSGIAPGFGFPVFPYGYVDTSDDLSLRLNDLLQRRAGLEALWRELENDARIAQVPQVWLAP
jgi:hypothetical protein